MIWLAISLDELGIFAPPDGTHKGMKTMTPLRIDETSSPLGAPDKVEIHAEVLPCHILSNWMMDKLVQKISGEVPRLRRSLQLYPLPRPDGRGYLLPALRASNNHTPEFQNS